MAKSEPCRFALGRRIRTLRDCRNWTQDQLAARAEMDPKSIGSIERGERNVTVETAARIAVGLGVEVHQLFLFDARGILPPDQIAEVKIVDAIRVAPPRKKVLMLNLLNEVINFSER